MPYHVDVFQADQRIFRYTTATVADALCYIGKNMCEWDGWSRIKLTCEGENILPQIETLLEWIQHPATQVPRSALVPEQRFFFCDANHQSFRA